ncbi:PREDICTED: serine/threonine-protein kinase/endoribonuclease IRE1a-like, partial [Erythranthe guttata]|uniref:serine/threonine-protein kinase/endoribonuclease IRE1a-like n=1 Tax=Erythranthe guttata TaxID=4155 RepID=UPI00064E062E
MTISDHEVIGRGRNTTVLEGIYDGRSVTIKRCGRSVDNDILLKKQADAMIIYDVHPNIVRYIGKEEDPYFTYLCVERCTYNLSDFICQSPLKSKLWTIIGTTCNSPEPILYPSALFLQLMRDIVMGLDHLHSKEFVHGNLKPTNILIIEEIMCAKISLDNCLGCQSKEAITNGEQTFADDLYSLGRILLFCISNGKCPFAESLSEHEMQIANKQNILLIDIVEARDLITRLLNVKAPS